MGEGEDDEDDNEDLHDSPFHQDNSIAKPIVPLKIPSEYEKELLEFSAEETNFLTDITGSKLAQKVERDTKKQTPFSSSKLGISKLSIPSSMPMSTRFDMDYDYTTSEINTQDDPDYVAASNITPRVSKIEPFVEIPRKRHLLISRQGQAVLIRNDIIHLKQSDLAIMQVEFKAFIFIFVLE